MFFVSFAALVWLDVRLIDVTPQSGLQSPLKSIKIYEDF